MSRVRVRPFILADAIERFWQKVEKTDSCWVWTAATASNGYGQFVLNTTTVTAHRFALELCTGHSVPRDMDVDHVCFNRRCVNPAHLRVVTRKQNMEHVRGARRDSQTGVRGVGWNKRRGKYYARVTHRGTVHFLGYFSDLDSADRAARSVRSRLFTHDDYELEAGQ